MGTGIIIAGTHTGCGKTTVALALMAALSRDGCRVAPFKIGPDFIDPGHHRLVTGNASTNLDGWMLTQTANRELFARRSAESDVAVVEGVMGLFDGVAGGSETGSTAQMAKWLNLPVLLVVDAGSMARSAAALVRGFEHFDPGLGFAGVLFNNISGPGHLEILTAALDGTVAMPCLGGLGRDDRLTVPERHLGLATVEDHPWAPETIEGLAAWLRAGTDWQQVTSLLAGTSYTPAAAPVDPPRPPQHPPDAPRIGVARDRAFCFYYPENLDMLAASGAELVTFSPIADRRLPPNLHGIYLGGGYPELSAEALCGNTAMRRAIRSASREGMPIYGECGGFMYLCRELIDADGRAHAMAGCFPFAVRMDRRLRALGYREVTLSQSTPLGRTGDRIRGHEFHYSSIAGNPESAGIPTVFALTGGTGRRKEPTGFLSGQTLGSYLHLHFGSNPAAAAAFVNACKRYQKRETPHP
jgi:cobyrinic acid a,c-diamide synthase